MDKKVYDDSFVDDTGSDNERLSSLYAPEPLGGEDGEQKAKRLKALAEAKYKAANLKSALKDVKRAYRLCPNLDGLSSMVTSFEILSAASKSTTHDWYKILQVEPFCHINTIKKQYKKLALLLHPDKNPYLGSEETFKLVNEGFRVLSDKVQRKEYDTKLRNQIQDEKIRESKEFPVSGETFWTTCSRCQLLHQFERKYLGHNLVCRSCRKSFEAVEVGNGETAKHKFRVRSERLKSKNLDGDERIAGWIPKSKLSKIGLGRSQMELGNERVKSVELKKKDGDVKKGVGGGEWSGGRLRKRMSSVGDVMERSLPKRARIDEETMTLAELRSEIKSKTRQEKMSKLKVNEEKEKAKRQIEEKQKAKKEKEEKERTKKVNEEKEKEEKERAKKVNEEKEKDKKERARKENEKKESEKSERAKEKEIKERAKKEEKERAKKVNEEKEKDKKERARKENEKKESEKSERAKEKEIKERAKKVNEKKERAKKESDKKRSDNSKESKDSETQRCSLLKKSKDLQSMKHGTLDKIRTLPLEGDKMSKKSLPGIMLVEDSDFYDFDKDRIGRSFKQGQVWAMYADDDGMPRDYGLIDEVVSVNPFEVKLSWLDFQDSRDEGLLCLEKMGFNLSCGRFKVSRKTSIDSVNIFSHVVDCERAAREVYRIYPKKGSVWAVYTEPTFSAEGRNVTTTDRRRHYDIVLFLTTYSEMHGLSMTYLEKVAGFKTIFKRREIGSHAIRWLEKDEVQFFSHQIPARKLSGGEASELLKDCWELDPASLPADLLSS
ncbi:hypothetical protein F8388_022145 [Cannabis sativa]|uniref:J domain-containing protein n=1 Tax=Cannabis sativa TaxID=3483 RepID=A0A7J6G8C0_CANSA|nr:hypothetical protein F8388_022145 [Cannabis sativa]